MKRSIASRIVRLLFGIAMALLLLFTSVAYFRLPGSREKGTLDVDPPTPYFRYPPSGPERGRVLVVHGLNSSKNTMSLVSRRLAEAGFEVIAVDLPGHGDSGTGFNALKARRVLENVLDSFKGDTAVVGHSLGGGLLVDIANERSFRSMVLLSPAPTPVQQVHADRVLLFQGEFDPGRIRIFGPQLTNAVTGTVEFQELDWTGHSGALFKPAVLDSMAVWLGGAAFPSTAGRRRALWFLMFLSSIGAGIALMGVGKRRPSMRPSTRPSTTPPVTMVVLYYIAAGILAVVILWFVDLTSWLQLFATDYLIGFLFLTGLALSLRRYKLAVNLRPLAVALCATIYVITIPGLLMGSELMHLSMTDGRAWRFLAIVILGFPLFLADEMLIRPVQPWLKSAGLALLTRVLIAATVSTAVLTIKRPDAFVLMLVPLLLLFWTGLWFLSSIVWRRTRDPLSTALFSSLTQGWVFAATFVIT